MTLTWYRHFQRKGGLKQKTEKHEHKLNSGPLERYAVPAPLEKPVIFILKEKNILCFGNDFTYILIIDRRCAI
jgi:hypothetical protein